MSDNDECLITESRRGRKMNGAPSTNFSRMRRTVSISRAEDIQNEEKKLRARQPDRPCHHPNDSLLSSSSGYNNYRGLLNLCIVLLVLSNARVALENIIKYGILIDPIYVIELILNDQSHLSFILLLLSLNAFILFALAVEKLLSKLMVSEKVGIALHASNLFVLLLHPVIFVLARNISPVSASIALLHVSIVFLKLISYSMVNSWCRWDKQNLTYRKRRLSVYPLFEAATCNSGSLLQYPDNLNLRDMYYFMFVPTLCYELNFPRSSRIRKRYLISRILESLLLSQLIMGLIQQWMIPTIENSMKTFKEMDFSRMLERFLKLAVPNLLIWLMFFYWYFHSSLNILAEVLRFSDRKFYMDWWNSESISYFWKNWNIPVHRWCMRHVYRPLLRRGYSKMTGGFVVFLLSAFFHEYLVSVPLKMFRLWAFTGMLMQLPLSEVVKKCFSGKYANMAVWMSLIIGQPLAILMYYHDYYLMNN